MNNNESNMGWQSVVAIVNDDNEFKGVELRKQDGSFEILWTRSNEDADVNWRGFAAECGLSVEPTALEEADSDRMVVAGFNTEGTIFHRTTVPAVGDKEIESIIRLQAETRLPLPSEQIELTWRTDQLRDGQMGVTIAVARKEQLQKFVGNVRCFKPGKILLNSEGIVKIWEVFFSGNKENALVLSAGAYNTQVCLVEGGRLSNAVVLDIGIDDFSTDVTEGQSEATERFAQDMRSVLDLFDCSNQEELPVFVLSDGSASHVSIVSSLRLAGLNARVATPNINGLMAKSELSDEDIYQYRTPIGLALLALEADSDELNIFENLYNPYKKIVKSHWLYSSTVALAIASIMLVLLVVVSYAVDITGPNSIEKRIEASVSDVDMNLLVKRQQLIKTVARERPDLLDLFKVVNESGEKGITLTSFYFKKGQPVSISGQASSNDQLSRYEKNLQNTKGIEKVNYNANTNTKSKKITFTMTFHYKNFSTKTTKRKS
jgi:Tfp pilus assembly PilM family ATPase